MSNNRYWYVPHIYGHLLPADLKKSNYFWCLSNPPNRGVYAPFTLLFNLTPEDLTYLKLLGIDLREEKDPEMKEFFNKDHADWLKKVAAIKNLHRSKDE